MKGDGIAKKVPKIGRQKSGNANCNSLHHKYVDAPTRQATEHAHQTKAVCYHVNGNDVSLDLTIFRF